MSVDHLITELEHRNLLSERTLERLREATADPARPLSARALAKFLVQKQHLTQLQATNVIHALVAAGVDVDATGPPSTLIGARRIDPVGISASELDEEDPEDEGSSIFGPSVPASPANSQPREEEQEDELTLVAIDDEMDNEVAGLAAAAAADNERSRREESPPVGLLLPSQVDGSGTTESPSAEIPWSIEPADDSRQVSSAELGTQFTPAPFDEEPSATRSVAAARLPSEGRTARKRPNVRKKQWDSPLILYGGGGLALMLLIGAGVLWILSWEKGDQELAMARDALNNGAYDQAIEHYEHFLVSSPRHPARSQARVQLATTRIRQATEVGNFAQALQLAPQELEAVEDEEDFGEAHGELASLLPQIATGLARQAEQARPGDTQIGPLVAQAKTALDLCNNALYIPKTLRDEGQLNVVREMLRRVERREQSHAALEETLIAMDKAIGSGDTAIAYSMHKRLVKERLELAGNPKLAEMLQKAAAAEQSAVTFVREERAAESSERPTPWIASLALAQRRGAASAAAGAPGTGPPAAVACVRVDGAVYGLDVATGKLIWRRYVGADLAAWPVHVDGDVLVSDVRSHELLRLSCGTGKLVWRQTIGEAFAEPLIVGPRAFVAGKSGRLYVIDLASGARAGYLQFPQPLAAPPTVDRSQQRIYLPAAQYSLYTISLADLSCLGAYYLGHESTSIPFAATLALNKLAVLENEGVETSRLRLFSLDERGAVAKQETEQRLTGLAASPFRVEGRRLVVVTDRGQFDVYEVTPDPGKASLAQLATRDATDAQPVARYVAVADGHIWVADTRLTKHAILPTGNRLPVESIENNFAGAAFDHPLELFGSTLVHVRRPHQKAGAIVAATEIGQGSTLWETELAVPPAAAPVVDQTGRALVVANSNGYAFRFDESAIRSRVQDEPIDARSKPPGPTPLTSGIDFGDGRAAFFAAGADQLLLYDSNQARDPLKWVKLASPLACAATSVRHGLLVPTKVGQVFYLSPENGRPLATPFQPVLEPRSTVDYRPAGALTAGASQTADFVITDGREKIYLVKIVEQPQSHLQTAAEGHVGADPIVTPVAVLGELAIAATEGGRLVRYRLPSLEPAGTVDLPGYVVWGPFRVGRQLLLATADESLVGIGPAGEVAWTAPLEHGRLTGAPLADGGGILLAYRRGVVERRDPTSGKPRAQRDVEHPLAAGPVAFAGRIVLAANDGTLLVVDKP